MSKRTVLIVDNEKINRQTLKYIFSADFHVLEANDVNEAIDIIKNKSEEISIILLDILVPGKDTFQFMNELKKNDSLCDIPIIIAMEKNGINELKVLELGAWDIITKPYDPVIIINRVNNVLQKKRITDIVAENAKLRQQTRSQSQLKVMLDNMLDGVSLIEFGDEIKSIYRNKKFYELVGDDNRELNDEEIVFLDLVCDKYKKLVMTTLEKSINGNEQFVVEFKLKKLSGDQVWIEGRYVRIAYDGTENPVILVIIRDITEDKEKERKEFLVKEEIRYRAEHDELTGIYNRHAFCSRTEKMLRENPQEKYILIRWNIDRFKVINALLGIAVGNKILIEMARYIALVMHGFGTYGRIEADHFVTCYNKKHFNVDRIQNKINGAIKNLNLDYKIEIYYGIYEIDDINLPVEQMCDRANLALKAIKNTYFTSYAFYDNKLRDELLAEQEVVNEMRNAIDDKSFCVFLQPIRSASTYKIISAEALVRWMHPTRGMIAPNEFIPIFEKNGFITTLDYYVWEEVCKVLKKRKNEGKKDIPISVNLSRRSVYSTTLIDDLLNLVKKYDIEIKMLKLEITETAYTEDPKQIIDTVSKLRSVGFIVLMDDFGSGYSSLNMLKDLPVDILKIDMKFLEGFDESSRAGSIVTSVVRMASWLRIPVVAEGVENIEQLKFLRSIGCEQIQGYIFAKPMPIDEFESYVTKEIIPSDNLEKLDVYETDVETVFGGNKCISKIIEGSYGGMAFYEMTKDCLEIIRVNSKYYEIHDYTPEGFAEYARNIWAGQSQEYINAHRQPCIDAIMTQTAQRRIVRDFKSNGQEIWLDCVISCLGGTLERAIICVAMVDITDKIKNNPKRLKNTINNIENLNRNADII